ncbi:MAG: hypothetical protein IKD77_00150 [Bacilli bacterium]|nr:hypothetical protein [Bacilli bacterium]
MKKEILIGALVLLVIISVLVSLKLTRSKPEEKPEQKEEPQVQKEDLNMVAEELLKKIDDYYLEYYGRYEEVDFTTSMDNTLLATYAYSLKKNEGKFNKEIVDKYYKEVFNIELNEHQDLNCYAGDGILYKFDTQKNDYVEDCGSIDELCHSHGGLTLNAPLFIKAKEITKESNLYTLYVNEVYGLNVVDNDGYFYSDGEYQNRINELDFFLDNTKDESQVPDINKVNIEELKKYYNDNYENFKDKLPIYEYIFKKESENFYLIKVKKIN